MGCVTKHSLSKETTIGVWEIEEDLPTLLNMVTLEGDDIKRYSTFRSTSRKIEFLSVRALLAELTDADTRIVYNKNNKPFIKDGSQFISISHSHKLTAILLSTTERVGIDLEYMTANISAFSFKFINRKEKITRDKEQKRYHLYIHWCAKESIYKICDKEGISIRNDITIEPFNVAESGEIKGRIKNKTLDEVFTLNYSRYDNYVIVWTTEKYDVVSI
jgi:4'-phosphopantetheinyl transferase